METKTILKPAVFNETSKERLYFIDNIRYFMIILVVLVHINVTYSGIGGWYYIENNADSIDTLSKVLSGALSMFLQAFFMGLLFFIAGYFVPSSFDRKGSARFIKDRLFRLGVPVIIYMFIVNPFIIYFLLTAYKNGTHWPLTTFYGSYIKRGDFIGGTGPLWFALALLVFSLVYSLIRLLGVKPIGSKKYVLSLKMVFSLIIFVSVITFAVRLYFPFGTSIYNMQLCFFTQYIVLFTAGIISYRKNIFMNIPYEFGVKWLKYGVSLGMVFWIIIILAGGAINGNENAYFGGLTWQAASYSFWESIICASMSLGLLTVFREKYNTQGKMSKFLSDNAFGVYSFHAPILIFISISLKNLSLYPILKIILVAAITLPSVFAFSYIIRKIPVIKKLYS